MRDYYYQHGNQVYFYPKGGDPKLVFTAEPGVDVADLVGVLNRRDDAALWRDSCAMNGACFQAGLVDRIRKDG